ncbi:MAG: DMT family transporter, partial [Anaerolineae bacterium]
VGYVGVILATACWGTSALFVKLVLNSGEISALALAFWRDLTTFLVLLIGLYLLKPEALRVRRRDLKWLIALGGSLGTFHVFWNLAVFLNGAAVATVQQAAMPAIVAVVAWLVWRESLTTRKILAIFLTFIGTVLVSGVEILGETNLTMAGLLVGLGTPLMYAAWNLFGKQVRGDYGPFTILTYGFGFGALVLLPFQFFTPQPWPVPAAAWLPFAGLIGIATVAGFSIYTFSLGQLEASVATILAMTEIPIVAIYATLLLHERLTPDEVLGSTLVVAGVLMLYWRGRTRQPGGSRHAGRLNRVKKEVDDV